MHEFPHLKDTSFPDLANVDVYRFQNTFDYTRWSEDTKVRLVNVVWNSDYSDVVKFDNDSKRDNYFDNLHDKYTLELTQAARIVPENYIKLPIPYDVMARYNYLYIDLPIATSESTPLDYETDEGIRRWYFFIDNVVYLSPNSTQVFLTLDIWTNFINDVEINYMMLERGHAPVSASDTDKFLSNPIDNNEYLLAPDVNFDNAAITRNSDYIPFGNGTKYVCIASTCAPEQIGNLGSVVSNPAFDPFTGNITYSDVDIRYGKQLEVHGFTLGTGKDFSTAKTPAKVGASDNGLIPNNLSVYAIQASECYKGTFFNDVLAQCPQFLNTVKACFVVDESCITLGASYSIAGHTVRRCVGTKRNLFTKQLAKSDFKYPTEYQRFAKLYTSPYAVLECTDNDGTVFTINIEETSTVQVKSVVSVAFPYIDYKVYLDGIGGVGSSSYSWKDLRNETHNLNISNSDWFKYCFDWEIPTFALYMDGETAYQLSSFNRSIKNGIRNALIAYHTTMRSVNTANENAKDSAHWALQNTLDSARTAKENSDRSAEVAKENADRSADTYKENSDISADTGHTNAYNAAATENTNAHNAATTARENAHRSADTNYTNLDASCDMAVVNLARKQSAEAANNGLDVDMSLSITPLSVNTGEANWWLDMATAAAMQAAESEAATTLMGNTLVQNVGSSVINGATEGFKLGGPTGAGIGAGISVATGVFSAALSAQQQAVALTKNGQVWDTQAANGDRKWDLNRTLTLTTTDEQNRVKIEQLQNRFDCENDTQANSNALERANGQRARDASKANANATEATSKTNADNTADTSRTNADNTQNASKTMAANNKDTAKTNAGRIKETTNWNARENYDNDTVNAQRTHDAIVANSNYTRFAEEQNAKEILENAANQGMAPLLDARNNQPIAIGSQAGNPSADYMETRGIQIKVKTQSDSAIRQTGDIFARYGYALNQVWNVAKSGLCLMRNFTYWKSSDIWVDDRKSSTNVVQSIITKIFTKGVTVWNDPEKIGRVSIYDN